MSRAVIPKAGREVLRAFKKAGLEVELRSASKHYLVYFQGELVYKFGQGTTSRAWMKRSLEATIRRCQEANSPSG
jgi:hypothetical protein